MSRFRLALCGAAVLLATNARAEVPRVVTDIAPVHSLAALVMRGVGEPALIVPPGSTPHEHALRPSEADALQSAEVVFWIGESLTPWLGDALDTLASDAEIVALPALEGVRLLETRESALFEAHEHHDEDGHGEDDEHAGDDHHAEDDEHAGEDGHGEEEMASSAAEDAHHDDEHDDEHAHAHGEFDPHAWLSPDNAKRWLDAMASVLARADAANAEAYAANAAAARAELDALESTVTEMLAPVRNMRFVVFHDAYQYFEDAFDLSAAGAISLGDASDPSPARVERIQRRIRDERIGCVLAEPQFNDGLVATVTEGMSTRTAVIDPIGAALEPGPALYTALLSGMAESLNDCL